MNYDEIKVGQRVNIITKRRSGTGTVVAKELNPDAGAGESKEIVYIDDDRYGRVVCSPSVLEVV